MYDNSLAKIFNFKTYEILFEFFQDGESESSVLRTDA